MSDLSGMTPEVSPPSTWEKAARHGCETGIISMDPNRLHGAPEFPKTRVPVRFLVDALQGGESLEQFLDSYPAVTREQAEQVLELAFTSTIGPRDAQNPVR